MTVIWPRAFRDVDEDTYTVSFVSSMIHVKIGDKECYNYMKNVERKLAADKESVLAVY